MKITSPDGEVLAKVTVSLTPGEAKWFLDMLDNQIEDLSEEARGEVKLAFHTNTDD